MKKFSLIFVLILLALAALLPGCSLAAETPWGRVKVVGYMDEDQLNTCGKMWAPQAVLTSKPHVDDMYLQYRYVKFDSETRAWQLKLVNKEGKTYHYGGKIDIILPYPAKWDSTVGDYWKWTMAYADRFQWAYSVGTSKFAYENYGGLCVAGYYQGDSSIKTKIKVDVDWGSKTPTDAGKAAINETAKAWACKKINKVYGSNPSIKIAESKEEFNEDDTDSDKGYETIASDDSDDDDEDDDEDWDEDWDEDEDEEEEEQKSPKFILIEPNESYGHRIHLRAQKGILPSVCMKIYRTKPSYDDCAVKAYLGTFYVDNVKVDVSSVTYFKGFMVDTRPEKYKQNPNFWDFLDRHKNSLGTYVAVKNEDGE